MVYPGNLVSVRLGVKVGVLVYPGNLVGVRLGVKVGVFVALVVTVKTVLAETVGGSAPLYPSTLIV